MVKQYKPFRHNYFGDCVFHLKGSADVLISQSFSGCYPYHSPWIARFEHLKSACFACPEGLRFVSVCGTITAVYRHVFRALLINFFFQLTSLSRPNAVDSSPMRIMTSLALAGTTLVGT